MTTRRPPRLGGGNGALSTWASRLAGGERPRPPLPIGGEPSGGWGWRSVTGRRSIETPLDARGVQEVLLRGTGRNGAEGSGRGTSMFAPIPLPRQWGGPCPSPRVALPSTRDLRAGKAVPVAPLSGGAVHAQARSRQPPTQREGRAAPLAGRPGRDLRRRWCWCWRWCWRWRGWRPRGARTWATRHTVMLPPAEHRRRLRRGAPPRRRSLCARRSAHRPPRPRREVEVGGGRRRLPRRRLVGGDSNLDHQRSVHIAVATLN